MKDLIEGIIIIVLIYNIVVGLQRVIAKDGQVFPLLYEKYIENSEEKTERVTAIEKVKNFGFFTKKHNENIKKNNIDHPEDYTGGLKLVGVIRYSEGVKSMAVLDIGGEHKTYSIYDIIDGYNITIAKILSEQIIIKNNESYYSLNIP